jgi:hypothetical protein
MCGVGCQLLVVWQLLAVGSWQLAVGSWKLKPYKIPRNFELRFNKQLFQVNSIFVS